MSKIRFHILLAALLVVTGCGEDDKVLPEQQQQFESFLSGSHQPRLVTEQEAMSSDEDLDFYSTFGRWSYRYIYHYYDSERQTRPEAEIGDEVDLVFWVYLFENRAITASTMPIYTNDRKWAENFRSRDSIRNTGVSNPVPSVSAAALSSKGSNCRCRAAARKIRSKYI